MKKGLELSSGIDRTNETSASDLGLYVEGGHKFTTHVEEIAHANTYIVTVPTPINEDNIPELSPLISASNIIGSVLNRGDLVIYESTVYPGVTEEICVPVLIKQSGLSYNIDFFCGYSPERINPGDKRNTLSKIVKITAGSNEETATVVDGLYKKIITAGTYRAVQFVWRRRLK